ncbi:MULTISPECIES: hypothetical protein [Rhizobium]|uniref:Uncharacterized protein n=1 Tax=Rhizobium favelukesii TaxID=348824 RepID=W6RDA6_9HYPH|nr:MULTISPECIES: hypothetical protein [Rhizobium]MCA0802874.1 hypothetical protein [Rhizobium sp. T1473]MCS0461295.1 hypothetical protein [Rhizobium favelukesii]UFS84444.1 hypothetical protein LPB79_15230 [Rhizobium sp. T136]CDM58839.1 hypothetical protein LPU83_3189 [Rhizobium favelukesii]
MEKGVEFAKAYFKPRAKAIEELAARSEGFRDLCDDFATASSEKLEWERSSGPDRDERIGEYTELVGSLQIEIEQALDQAHVVPFTRPRQ